MRKSLFWKTLAGFLLLFIPLTSAIVFFSARLLTLQHREQLVDHLRWITQLMSPTARPLLTVDRPVGSFAPMEFPLPASPLRVTLIAHDGKVLVDSEKNPAEMENHRNRIEVFTALRGQEKVSVHFSSSLRKTMLYYAQPITDENKVIGVLRLSLPARSIREILAKSKQRLMLLFAVIILISAMAAFFLSRTIVKPVRELIDVSRRIKAGDLAATAIIRNRDELKTLADHFNDMTTHQKKLIDTLQQKQDELAAILASLTDPLVVIDQTDRILLFNRAFSSLCNCPDGLGKNHWEAIREPGFQTLLRKAIQAGTNFEADVEIGDREYVGSVQFLPEQKGQVVLLRDITERKRLDRIKRDFVVNMSHELRTPLTAIKGFSETLAEEIPDSGREYIEIIQRNTDRMIHIVQDLMTLAELEETRLIPEMASVDLPSLVRQIVPLFEKKAREKGLDFRLDIDKAIPSLRGDAFRLEQLLINLVDNAVRYTDQGDIRMQITSGDGQVRIVITDTGIGIPADQQKRIFERFYVVDKSRSRQSGGTGLGLAIVKHIVRQHNGEIVLTSEPGAGSRFTVTLPT